MMKNHKNGQKLRLEIIKVLKNNWKFGGSESSELSIVQIMEIMGITKGEVWVGITMHVFKCPQCDKEIRVSQKDTALINEAKIEAPQCCGGYCHEDRIEVMGADGTVGTVIV